MKRVTNQGTKIAVVLALVAAGAVFAYALVEAVRVEPVEAGAPLEFEVAELPAGIAMKASWTRGAGDAVQPTDELLALAVANDPFRPDRRPGPAYVMPWERRTPVPRREDEDDEDDGPEWPDFRVVGFALTQNGGAALVQHDEDMPILLAMGERIRGYELIAVDTVDGGAATLVGPAGQLRFPVREPRVDDDDRRRRRRRGDDDDDDDRRRALERRERQLQQVQEILRRRLQQQGGNAVIRLRGGGGAPELMNLAPAPRWQWVPDAGLPARRDRATVGGARTTGPGAGGRP